MGNRSFLISASKASGILLFSLCWGVNTAASAACEEVYVGRSLPAHQVTTELDRDSVSPEGEAFSLSAFSRSSPLAFSMAGVLAENARPETKADVERRFESLIVSSSDETPVLTRSVGLPGLDVGCETSADSIERLGSVVFGKATVPEFKIDSVPFKLQLDLKPLEPLTRPASPSGGGALQSASAQAGFQGGAFWGGYGAVPYWPWPFFAPLPTVGFLPPPPLPVSPFFCDFCHGPGFLLPPSAFGWPGF